MDPDEEEELDSKSNDVAGWKCEGASGGWKPEREAIDEEHAKTWGSKLGLAAISGGGTGVAKGLQSCLRGCE